MQSFLLCFSLSIAVSSAQFFYHQSPDLQLAFQPHQYQQIGQSATPQTHAHPAVVDNSLRESQLPPELLKSDKFYKNPRIAAALAKESWFTAQEMPVINREAEKIPRDMVYKLFKNAGWIKRR